MTILHDELNTDISEVHQATARTRSKASFYITRSVTLILRILL
jgi:hypothetical protein